MTGFLVTQCVASKVVALSTCCQKLPLSVTYSSNMREYVQRKIQSLLLPVYNHVQVRLYITAVDSKLVNWKPISIGYKAEPLPQHCYFMSSATSCSQQRTILPFSRRQHSPLRYSLPHQTHPGNTRSFITSTTILASASPTQRLSQESAASVPMQEVGATPSWEAGVDTIQGSVAETVPGAQLMLPDFPTIRAAELTIQKLHEITGLPWWATITLTAVALRMLLILPLSLYSFHNAEKLNRLQPEILDISKRLKQEVGMAMHQFKWDEKKAKKEYVKNMNRLIRDLQIKHNCHPMKNTASFWLQFPVWISVSYSLRNMTSRAVSSDLDGHEECAGLTDEGALWFTDLTATDSTWILPVLMGSVTLFNVEMTHLNIGEVTKYRKRLTLFLRCLALLFIPISSTMPTAMVFYWVNSGFLAAAQNMMYDYSPLRRLMGLSQSPTESTSPVKALLQRAKLKYLGR